MQTPLLDDPHVDIRVFEDTFRIFILRKLARKLHVPSSSPVAVPFWVVAYIGALGAALCAGWSGCTPYGLRLHAGPFEVLLATTLCVITLMTITHTHIDVEWRWCTYWTYLASLTLISTRDFAANSQLRWRAALALCGLELTTLGVCAVVLRVMPFATMRLVSSIPVSWIWDLRRVDAGMTSRPDEHNERRAPLPSPTALLRFSYRPRVCGCPVPGTTAHVCCYHGHVEASTCSPNGEIEAASSCRPHGHGEWTDDASDGERLRGHWEGGVPCGPFRARVVGSGHAFVCVKIGYWASHTYPMGDTHMRTSSARLAGTAVRCGVSAVECAVSGQYFRNFPVARLASEEEVSEDVSRVISKCMRLLPPSAEQLAEPEAATPAGAASADVALIYIPGYNTPLAYALKRFGQLLALARLPAHMKPLVFSWPGGRALSYLSAAHTTAQPWMARDLLGLLSALHAHGVRTVHLLAHSMGARLVMHALPALQASPLLSAAGGIVLGSTVFLSPDYPVDAFVASAAKSLAALGTVTTVYGDRNDRPLRYSEMLMSLLTPRSWRSLGRLDGAPWAGTCDIDVIDTTHMHAGLPAGDPDLAVNTTMRHSQFTINQIIVDDLVDHLTTGRRAAQRSARLHLRAATGVFHFFSGDEGEP